MSFGGPGENLARVRGVQEGMRKSACRRWATWVVVAALAAATAIRSPGREDSAVPAGAPAAARSASHKAGPAAYPPAELVGDCRKAADDLRKRLDDKFAILVRPPFVIAGNTSAEDLEHMARWSVLRPAEAMWAGYFEKRPDKVITVLLFKGDKAYRSWAGSLFGDKDLPHFGYYRPRERALVMNIDTGTGTLVHELTHALIVYDFPEVPTWFNEGLASLHEQCTVGEREITGLPNWRLPALQEAIAKGTLRPLRELVTRRDFYGAGQGLNYAQARYFCLYAQRAGKLTELYRKLRSAGQAEGADVKAIEAVMGKPIQAVEKEMIELVKGLRFGR